jgi:hypothetical protein
MNVIATALLRGMPLEVTVHVGEGFVEEALAGV